MTRTQERYKSARRLCGLSYDYLFDKFGITRISDLTGLDIIGVPVWASTRPIAHTITYSGGKNLDPMLAEAGAIAEGIELAVFEGDHPQGVIKFFRPSILDQLPIRKGFEIGDGQRFEAEPVTHYLSGQKAFFPSDLIWLTVRKDLSAFQRNSNGQAIGADMDDAILTGLYECVERDAMTIRHRAQDEFGVMPPRIDLSGATGTVKILIDMCSKAGFKIYAFCTTFDVRVPSVKVFLVDPSETFLPTCGMGTSIWDSVAIEKAILEAIQSRLVFIGGGRDDIWASDFYKAKESEQRKTCRLLDTTPVQLTPYWGVDECSTETEIKVLLHQLGDWKNKVFVKTIPGEFPAAKTFIMGLETVITEDWQPGRWKEVRKAYAEDFNICRANSLRERAQTAV